jgi:hypothetical protein
MAATALYTLAMSPADAFGYTREALQSAGMTLGQQITPTTIEFSLTRKDAETVSIDAIMPGRATIAPGAAANTSTVSIAVEPASQFIIYAAGIGVAALVVGSLFINASLWFLIVAGAEVFLFYSIFTRWPADALTHIHSRMVVSPKVSGGNPAPQPAPVYATSPPTPAAPATPPRTTAADVADEIRHLAELRDQGHITAEEFEAKKTELLKRI